MQISKTDLTDFLVLVSPLCLSFIDGAFSGVLFNFVRLLLGVTVPGYYASIYLHSKYELSLDEFLVVDVVFSSLLTMFVYTLLTVLLSNVTYRFVWVSVFILSVCSYLLVKVFDKARASPVRMDLRSLVVACCCVLPAVIVVGKLLPREFWRGQDLWGTYAYVRGLLETSGSPGNYYEYIGSHVRAQNFGFYYMTTAYTLLSGFSIESVLRYGGLFQSILLSLTVYVALKRYYGVTSALIGSSSIFIHPLMGQRFVSILREDLGVIYLVFTFFFLNLRTGEKKKLEPVNLLTFTLLVTSSVVIHPLTPVFLITILVLESFRNAVQGDQHRVAEVYLSMIPSLFVLVVLVPLPLDYYSGFMRWFSSEFSMIFIRKLGENLLVFSSMMLLFYGGALLTVYKNRTRFKEDELDKLYTVFLVASVAVFADVLLTNPYVGGSPRPYEFSMFSSAVLFASLAGYMIYTKKLPFPVVVLSAILTLLSLVYYTGLYVPLERFGVYAIIVFTFSTTHLFHHALPFSDFTLEASSLKDLTRETKAWVLRNKYPLLVLFLVASYGLHETAGIRRYVPLFSGSDIQYGYEFKDQLNDDSLVYSPDHMQELLWYVGIPHDNLLTEIDHHRSISELLNQSDPYPFSDYLTQYYDVSTFYYCVSGLNEHLYGLKKEPLFEYYAERDVYGPMVVYTFRVPIAPANLPVNKIKFIDEAPLQHGLEDAETISNIVRQDGQYYTLARNRVDQMLTLYASMDGLTWHREAELGNSEARSLYLVSMNGELTVYGQDPLSCFITCYVIQNQSLVQQMQPLIGEAEHVYQEYPVVWHVNGTWRMIHWETGEGGDYKTGLVYSTSLDGVQWSRVDASLDWVLSDDAGRVYGWEKIQLTDVTPVNGGVIFHARYLAQDQHHNDTYWRTGTIYLEDGGIQNNAVVTSYVYKSDLSSTRHILDVRYHETPSGGRIIYYCVPGDGVKVGAPSDHYGIPEEQVVKP
jgi:hypothetical protein